MESGATSESSSSTSTSLLGRVKSRDPDAWERFVKLYSPLVYRWARQVGLQESDASDLAQEVFGVVAMRIDDFRRDRPGDSFRGWLWGITNNKLKEFFRRQAADPQAFGGTDAQLQLNDLAGAPPDDSADSPPLEPNAILMHRVIGLIQEEFEEKTWRAFWLTTVDERKSADVAEELGMTPKAVRQAKYRVLRRIRLELDDLA